jgi:plasmid stabilization system protein ParE
VSDNGNSDDLPRYQVIFTDVGQMAYDNAALWYAGHSPDTAAHWLKRFDQAIASLSTLPGIHPIAPESRHYNRIVRRLLYRPFRVLYYVVEPTEDDPGLVHIFAIRHGAARPLTEPEQDDEQ